MAAAAAAVGEEAAGAAGGAPFLARPRRLPAAQRSGFGRRADRAGAHSKSQGASTSESTSGSAPAGRRAAFVTDRDFVLKLLYPVLRPPLCSGPASGEGRAGGGEGGWPGLARPLRFRLES